MNEKLTAVILAGGHGSRLEPWHAPKCLMPIRGVTILQRLLKHLLVTHGDVVSRAIVCTGYRAADVEASIREHGWTEDQVVCSYNSTPGATMGERLAKAAHLLRERAIVCYGDELADVDVKELLKFHREGNHLSTFAAAEARIPGGYVCLDGQRVIEEDRAIFINIGFAVIEPVCWGALAGNDGLSDWINRIDEAVDRDAVGVYEHRGKRATVNTLADLRHAEEVWG